MVPCIERVAEAVAAAQGLDLDYLRKVTRRRNASPARAMVGHLGKVYGRIPFPATSDFFLRDASTLTKDIRAFEAVLLESRKERETWSA